MAMIREALMVFCSKISPIAGRKGAKLLIQFEQALILIIIIACAPHHDAAGVREQQDSREEDGTIL